MYLNNGGSTWTSKAGWFSNDDHCNWEGVTCSPIDAKNEFSVTELSLPSNQLTGSFPSDLRSLTALEVLNTTANSMVGSIPDNLCSRSWSGYFFVNADAVNCPNHFDTDIGAYSDGCCDKILIDMDIYLNYFAQAILGDDNCANLSGTEINVCNYMNNKNNHALFVNGYPEEVVGVWEWLKVRLTKNLYVVFEFMSMLKILFHTTGTNNSCKALFYQWRRYME